MSDEVKFEEEEILVDRASQVSRGSALTNFILRSGIAKDEAQASYILIGVMVACLLTTLFVISRYLI
jgi:hypothetical protein